MRGDLSEIPAAEVCRRLAEREATRWLSVDGPDGPGVVRFDQGRIVAASSPRPVSRLGERLVGAGRLTRASLDRALSTTPDPTSAQQLGVQLVRAGLVDAATVTAVLREQVLDALLEIVSWRYGTFRTDPAERHAPPPASEEAPGVRLDVGEVLTELASRRREWDEVRALIPHFDAVPTRSDWARSSSAPLEPDEANVLAHVDGDRSVRELAGRLGYGEFELARRLHDLIRLGVVTVTPAQDGVGRALQDALEASSLAGPHPRAEPEGASAGAPAAPADHGPADHGPADDEPAHDDQSHDDQTHDDQTHDEPAHDDQTDDESPRDDGPADAVGDDHAAVAEFLRELSRLAGHDPEPADPASSPHPATPHRGDAPDDDRRRRRGLFGRGG